MTPSTILFVDKAKMVALLHQQHAMSDRFISHMLTRNIRIEEDLIDQLFNSSREAAGAHAAAAGALRQAGQADPRRPADLARDAGGDDRHDALARELLPEQIQEARLHRVRRRACRSRSTIHCSVSSSTIDVCARLNTPATSGASKAREWSNST